MVTEQTIDEYIALARKLAADVGEGEVAAEVEPLALMGVHVGVAAFHLFRHIFSRKAKQPTTSADVSQGGSAPAGGAPLASGTGGTGQPG